MAARGPARAHGEPPPEARLNDRPPVVVREDVPDYESAARREWLVTNGLGGFACGTVSEANTRRYHALLVAAREPPLGRTTMVVKLDLSVEYLGQTFSLTTNEYAGGIIDPKGYRHLERFAVEDGVPTWRYAAADACIERRVAMEHGENTTLVAISVARASEPLTVYLRPFCTYRDYHALLHGGWEPGVHPIYGGFEIRPTAGSRAYRVVSDRGTVLWEPRWYWSFRHRAEAERGLDDVDDLYSPGVFQAELAEGEEICVVMSDRPARPRPFAATWSRGVARHRRLAARIPEGEPDWVRQLACAADQFVVQRWIGDLPFGRTIVAGYPWFGDWGRDAMLALPGLTLVTGRHADAAEILHTFAVFLEDGLLPNRFPDQGGRPEYGSADGSLWFVNALHEHYRRGGDPEVAETLLTQVEDILEHYLRGTRHGIGVDPEDGLLRAGEEGAAATWMDARVGERVVTPRVGKPVELNALWVHALGCGIRLSQELGRTARLDDLRAAESRAREGFAKFWSADLGHLHDVLDGPAGHESRLRPNQLLACSLPFAPLLDEEKRRSIVSVCARKLLTPVGLRTLSPDHPEYVGSYRGGVGARDSAYHQGTAWAWLLGPFAEAHHRAFGDLDRARSYLEPIGRHLAGSCLGQVGEIFDGDPPHHPRGCFAQAWSVAEVLRAWLDLKYPPAP